MLEKFTVIPPFTILLGDFHLDFRHKFDGDYRYSDLFVLIDEI